VFGVPFLLARIAEDIGMAQQGDPDDLDRELPGDNEDTRALGDDEFEDVDEGEEADLEDEDEVDEKA